eukprot:scaffold11004_cov38-Attheya_sp.AAC.1
MKGGEVKGKPKFAVPKSKLLELPTQLDYESERSALTEAVRETSCLRIEALHPSRKVDDVSYFEAVERGTEVALVTALHLGDERGGGVVISQLTPAVKWNAFTPIDLKTKQEATDRIAAFERRESDKQSQEVDNTLRSTSDIKEASYRNEAEAAEDSLMMDVDLVQKGVWQRTSARTLLPKLKNFQSRRPALIG